MKFSLRTLFIATTILIVVAGYFILRFQYVQDSFTIIRSHNVRVSHGDDSNGLFNRFRESLWPSKIHVDVVADAPIEVWQEIAKLERLEELRIAEPQTDQQIWTEAAKLVFVRQLDVDEVGDSIFDLVANLEGLESISITRSQVTGDRIEALLKQKRLRVLNLSYTEVDDSAIETICKLPDLEELYLISTNVTDRGVAHLVRIPNLQVLYLNETKVTGDCVDDLGKLESLRVLGMRAIGLPFDTTALFTRLGHLNLEVLDLPNVFLDEKDVPELQAVFPACDIKSGHASGRMLQPVETVPMEE